MAQLTSYNIWIVLFVCLGAYSYGFSFSVFATSIGEPGFYIYFDLDPASNETASIIGAISALFAAGAAFGAIIQGWTSDWLGRRKALAIGGIISVVGTTVVAGAVNIPMLFVFRFITGLGGGQLLALVPLYIAEVAPPHRRGLMSAGTGCSFSLGYLISAWIGYGCYFATDLTVQWRMPLCLCPIAPLLLVIGCYWAPESPRWLIWNGQKDEAWPIIQRLHLDPNDSQDLAAHAEFTQIDKQVEFDKQFKNGYYEMFTIPSFRKRTLLAILVIFAVQSTGNVGVTAYLILIAQSVGLTESMPLLIYSVYVVVAVGFNFVNALFIDKIGRRNMLLYGIAWTGTSLLAVALLVWKYSGTTNTAGNAAALLFINLFAAGVGFFLDPTQFIWCAEVFPTAIRAKGLTISLFTYFVGAILYTAPGPTAFANIGWKYYLVFVSCDVVSFILIYLYLPETTGLSLEEMGALFGDTVVTHLTADGTGLIELDAKDEFTASTSEVERVENPKEKDLAI